MLNGSDVASFLSAGGYHHHIRLNTRDGAGGRSTPPDHTRPNRIAILYPNRRELAKAVKRVLDHGHAFTGANRPLGARLYTATTRMVTG